MAAEPAIEHEPLPAEPLETVELPPTPTNLAECTWTMRRLRSVRRRIAEHDGAYQQLIEETEVWHAEIGGRLLAEAGELERQLENFMRAQIALDPKGPMSRTTPAGEIRSTKGSVTVEVDDEEAFLHWASRHQSELVRVPDPKIPPPEPDKKAIRAAATAADDAERYLAAKGDLEQVGSYELVDTATGEVVPGVRLARNDRTFKIITEGVDTP